MRRPPRPVQSLRAILVLALLWVGGCETVAPSVFGTDIDELIWSGETYTRYLTTRPAHLLTDPEVLALGYLERARLGLGSPFRLVEYALRDARLSEQAREHLAYALLAFTLEERGYQTDPSVLELVRLAGVPPGIATGEEQLRLIERTIESAPTAASGERAVRLGYRIAVAERTAAGVPLSVAAHVAALVADRREAGEDARALLRTAAAHERDPLELLVAWRRALRFQVEAPALSALSVREEAVEARLGPRVAQALRVLGQRMSAPVSLVGGPTIEEAGDAESLLTSESAARLQELAETQNYPPQAPIAVAVAINKEAFLSGPGLLPWQRDARAHFATAAWSEERLVSMARQLRTGGAAEGARLPLIELQAAVFLRVWNQEKPWLPGDPAPAVKDLEARFGLERVEFDDEVPESWRPYYRRVLARGLAELQQVLPTASARGLTIRIGEIPREEPALALHSPRTRTLFLPPRTGSGTLAHELAHDLDWQLARRRYGVRGGYATDLAVRRQKGDRIASSMTGLAAAIAPPRGDSIPDPHDTRPAEVFARGTDWLVAALLAREGRLGGYLTSFQDPALTGYGTTRGPDVGGGAVPALFAILDEIAPVVPEARQWAFTTHGPARTLSPAELAGAVLSAGRGESAAERFAAIERARDRALASLSASACRLSSAEGVRDLITAQRNLIDAAAGAAARGVAIEGAREIADRSMVAVPRSAVNAWMAWRLYGAPEPAHPALEELAPMFEELLYRAAEVASPEPVSTGTAFHLGTGARLCGGNPFASIAPAGRLGGEGDL
jgi:hypothetical protein